MLELRDISLSYRGARERSVLRNVDLDLGRGEYIAIMGESGVGKSTLLNLIAGLEVPDSGSLRFEGSNLPDLDDTARTLVRRDRMGFVFQAFHLLPHLTVAQNVGLPLALQRKADSARVVEMLAAVDLADRAAAYPRQLSGGEMQRVAIARALVHRPLLVLADEPTGNLDSASAALVLELLRQQIKESQGSGILVTHSASAAASADRVYELDACGLKPKPL